jgi:hypothetical protein
MARPKKINGNRPAAQKDLALWGGRLQEQVDSLETKVDRGFKKLESITKLTLKIVQGIDQDRQAEKKLRIPQRVTGLEDDVLKIKGDVGKIKRKLKIK